MAKTRHSKGRTKRNRTAKKPRKRVMAAKKAVKKTGKRGAKRRAKPRKAAKHAHKPAAMAPAKPIMISIKTEPAKPAAHAPVNMPAMPSGFGGDSVMGALVALLILIAVVSAGIFYPQTKAHQPPALDTGAMQHK